MADIALVHTAHLDDATLAAARAMTLAAFESKFTDDDWEHALGGFHAIARAGDAIIGHAAIVRRHLVYRGRALRAGYLEAVAVHPDHRREGVGDDLMAAVEPVIACAYDLGALSSTAIGMPFYESRGWLPWRGSLYAFTPDGIIHQPEREDRLMVFAVRDDIDLDADLTCDFRNGDLW
jgi:aminoglycoside 2'-N-acetyltransferase I